MKRHKKENIVEEEKEQEVVDKLNGEDVAENDNLADLDVQQKMNEEISMLNDKYLRLAAEFDNYRKRTLKEKQDLISFAGEEIIKGILPIMDDMERAIEMLSKAEKEDNSALEGTQLIYNKLKTYLLSKGVKEIDSIGNDLDTDFHEAIAQMPVNEDSMKNKIIDVVQKGYTMNGKVIRFAKVVMGQ